METPSADDARGGSPPALPSTPHSVPRAPTRARHARAPAPPSPLPEIHLRLDHLERLFERAGLATVSPRNKVLGELVWKLDHMHNDLVALREWARIPRPECYPDPPPDPTAAPVREGEHHA